MNVERNPTGICFRLYTCFALEVEKITSPLLLFYIMIFAQEFIIKLFARLLAPHTSPPTRAHARRQGERGANNKTIVNLGEKLLWCISKWCIVGEGWCWRKLNILAEACCWLSFLQIIHKPHIWWCGNYSYVPFLLLSFHVQPSLIALFTMRCSQSVLLCRKFHCKIKVNVSRRGREKGRGG